MYGKGKSERLIGEVFKGMRDEIVISTKYGYDFSDVEQIGHAELPQDYSPEYTRKALDACLERLQTDYLDSCMDYTIQNYNILEMMSILTLVR